MEELAQHPDVIRYWDFVRTDPLGNCPALAPDPALNFDDIIRPVLTRYLKDVGAAVFVEERIQFHLNDMFTRLSNVTQTTLFAPIINLYRIPHQLNLGSTLLIREMTESETELCRKYGCFTNTRPGREPRFLLEAKFEKRFAAESSPYLHLTFRWINNLLRLASAATTCIPSTFQTDGMRQITSMNSTFPSVSTLVGAPLFLGAKDAHKVESLWNTFVGAFGLEGDRVPRPFDRAIKRLNAALDGGDLEDHLVDLVIALEASFMAKEDHASRLGARVSLLIANNPEDQRYIRAFLETAYDVRSRIVHGDETGNIVLGKKSFTIQQFGEELFSIARRCLRRYFMLLAQGFDKTRIVSSLESIRGWPDTEKFQKGANFDCEIGESAIAAGSTP